MKALARLPGRWSNGWREGYGRRSEGSRLIAAVILALWASIHGFSAPDSPAQEAYARAARAMGAGRYRAALADLQVSVQLEPNRAAYQFAYAYALSRVGQTASARAAIAKCLKLRKDYPGALLLAGDIETDSGNYPAAVQYLEKALEQEPSNVDAMISLGLAYGGLGRYANSAEQFRAVTRLQPNFAPAHYNLGVALLKQGDAPGAEKEFRQVLKLAPNYERAQFQLANALVAQGQGMDQDKTWEAVKAYHKALELDPRNLDSHFNLGFALSLLRDDQGALAEYQKVAQVKPDYPQVQYYIAYTAYRLKDNASAAEHMQKALDQGTDNFLVRYCLGSALLQTGDKAGAKTHLEAAAIIDPSDPSLHFQLAKLYGALGDSQRSSEEYSTFRKLSAEQETKWHIDALKKSAEDALQKGDITKGIEALKEVYLVRKDVTSARNLGLAYLRTGDLEEAGHYLQEARKLSPLDAATHNYLGLLDANRGDLAGAQKEFKEAAGLDPSFADALFNVGLSSYELRQYDVAIKYFREALARSDTPEVHKALALALADAGRPDEAQQHLDNSRKLQ